MRQSNHNGGIRSTISSVHILGLQFQSLIAQKSEAGTSAESILLTLAERALTTPTELSRFRAYIDANEGRLNSCDFEGSFCLGLGSLTHSVLMFLAFSLGFEGDYYLVANALIDFYVIDPVLESMNQPGNPQLDTSQIGPTLRPI